MQDTHMLTTLESVKLIAKLTQLSTSSEEPQSPLSVDLPPVLTELLSQLIPQLSPLNILLPKELQSSMTSLSLPQSIMDMLDTHMLTTLESVKPKVTPKLTTEFLDTDMVSNMSQLSHLLEV